MDDKSKQHWPGISSQPIQVQQNADGTLTIFGNAVVTSMAAASKDDDAA